MTTAIVALGSNLGDRMGTITTAIRMIRELPGVISVNESTMIDTDPVGMAPGTPLFLNGAVQVETHSDVASFFNGLSHIETQLGRSHKGQSESRSIDLDLIFWGNDWFRSDELTVPHPRYRNRSFVMTPVIELCPTWVDPEINVPVIEIGRDLHRTRYSDVDHIDQVASFIIDQVTSMGRHKRKVYIGIDGEMGVGKTTLVRSIGHRLNLVPSVTSPTYDILHRHEGPDWVVFHGDLYRLSPQEVDLIDLECDFEENHVVVFLEWSNRLAPNRLDQRLTIQSVSPNIRKYSLDLPQ
ncbi:2-amino-4-hydroxy-6-hydroxymethyldihydropteridine diphosphokinase [bacterium]|nr:2-amino-4-hydroxy-6-hydroxymethyldihydropteridine diphosphokinase [bacterium]